MDRVSLTLLEKHAAEGSTTAQLALFKLYRNDKNVSDSLQRASQFLHQAAWSGHTRAMWQLGYAYQFGEWGVTKDPEAAMYWYRRLTETWKQRAKQGDGDAANVLAELRRGQ